jgi:non-heme chloroperoxidase
MLTATANGMELAYERWGIGSDVLFVHGIPTDYRAWSAQMPIFSENYRIVAFSRRLAQPNRNKASASDSTIENNAKDLEELIQQTTSPPINLVGHSYGGFIAAYLASKRPELIRKLVLIEPGISTLLIQDPASRGQMLSLLFRSPSVALAAGKYLRRYYNPMLDAYHRGDLDNALRLFLDGLMNRDNALAQLAPEAQTMMKENASTIGEVEAKLPIFTSDDARRISAPTLLINGANGTRIFQAINKKLASSIPKNEHIAITESSHFPHVENPNAFNQKVMDFLAKNP